MADSATTPATEAEAVNEVKIEDLGATRKKITITIPADNVDDRIDDSFTTLASEAAIPGFRKGRVPRKLIERRFGSSVMNETKNQLIADAYSKAIEDHKIKVVGDPDADELEKIEVEPGKPLTFSVEVEVAPEFEVPNLEGIEIKKPLVDITDDVIDDEIKAQCQRLGSVAEIEDAITNGDRLQGHAIVARADNDEVLYDLDDVFAIIPSKEQETKGHILGFLVDNLADLFVGKQVGDVVTITLTGSENDERTNVRGVELKITYTIHKGVRVSPCSVEQVVETYGLGDEANLRSQAKILLEQRAEQEQRAAMREQVFEHLLDTIDFELPEKLSAAQSQRLLDRMRVELLYRGHSVEDVEARAAELRAESEDETKRRLKLTFILARLAEVFEIQVTDPEINGRIAAMAAQRGERPEQVRAQFAREGRLTQIAMQLREHKTADRIIDKAKIVELSAEEWNKQVEAKQKDSEKPKKQKKKTKSKK